MRIVIGALALALIAAVAGAAALVLPACGLRLPFTGRLILNCPLPEAATELDKVILSNKALQAEIAAAEVHLAAVPCEATPPPVTETPSGLAPDAFDRDDMSVMEGCWELQSQYDVTDRRSGAVTRFREWRICFDASGNGREVMRATNGQTCEGRLSGRVGDGTLTISEPRNLPCSNGFYIYRRDITCSLDAAGTANCSTFQPEINGRGAAILSRAPRESE